jgi:hypothetical protein
MGAPLPPILLALGSLYPLLASDAAPNTVLGTNETGTAWAMRPLPSGKAISNGGGSVAVGNNGRTEVRRADGTLMLQSPHFGDSNYVGVKNLLADEVIYAGTYIRSGYALEGKNLHIAGGLEGEPASNILGNDPTQPVQYLQAAVGQTAPYLKAIDSSGVEKWSFKAGEGKVTHQGWDLVVGANQDFGGYIGNTNTDTCIAFGSPNRVSFGKRSTGVFDNQVSLGRGDSRLQEIHAVSLHAGSLTNGGGGLIFSATDDSTLYLPANKGFYISQAGYGVTHTWKRSGSGLNIGFPQAQWHVVNENAAQPVQTLQTAVGQDAPTLVGLNSSGTRRWWINDSTVKAQTFTTGDAETGSENLTLSRTGLYHYLRGSIQFTADGELSITNAAETQGAMIAARGITNGGGSVAVGSDGNVTASGSAFAQGFITNAENGFFVQIPGENFWHNGIQDYQHGMEIRANQRVASLNRYTGNFGINCRQAAAKLQVVNDNADQPVQTLKAAVGQTTPTFKIVDSSDVEKLSVGLSEDGRHYGLRVNHYRSSPNQYNVGAYFSATGASHNIALETGTGDIHFGGDLVFKNRQSIIGAGNTALGGAGNAYYGNLTVSDTRHYNAEGVGGSIILGGDDRFQGTQNTHPFASIRGLKENQTYLNRLGALAFGTQTDNFTGDAPSYRTTIKEWMFLRSDGVLELENCSAAPTALKFGDAAIYADGGAVKVLGKFSASEFVSSDGYTTIKNGGGGASPSLGGVNFPTWLYSFGGFIVRTGGTGSFAGGNHALSVSAEGSVFGTSLYLPQAQVHVANSNAARPAQILQAAVGQSAPYIKGVDSSDVEKWSISKDGRIDWTTQTLASVVKTGLDWFVAGAWGVRLRPTTNGDLAAYSTTTGEEVEMWKVDTDGNQAMRSVTARTGLSLGTVGMASRFQVQGIRNVDDSQDALGIATFGLGGNNMTDRLIFTGGNGVTDIGNVKVNKANFYLYDVANSSYKLVEMGAADSGGAGKRALVVAN